MIGSLGESLSLGKFRAERNGLSFGPRGLGKIEPNDRVRWMSRILVNFKSDF